SDLGEQAFVQAMMNGTLGEGRFVALTPCFRNEPVFDEVHQPYFMKVELFDTNAYRGRALEIAHEAQRFMTEVSGIIPEIIKTDTGYDLEVNGVEVGSYSSHIYGDLHWTCGTGLAEPRFTYSCNKGH